MIKFKIVLEKREVSTRRIKGKGGVCTPLRGNSICILCIFLEQIGIFWRNLAAPIQVSIDVFWHSCTRMGKLQLIITTYYLQVFWHDMNLKLTLGILLDRWSLPMILLTWSPGFFQNEFWSVNSVLHLLRQNLLRPKVNFKEDFH